MAKQKKKKQKFEDDGRVIADMNVEGTRWYRGRDYDPDSRPKPTRAEKRAIFKGAFLSMIPPLLCTLVGMGIAAVLLWLWLH